MSLIYFDLAGKITIKNSGFKYNFFLAGLISNFIAIKDNKNYDAMFPHLNLGL